MDWQILLGVLVLVAFVAGVLVAPKAHTYEAEFASELHALYISGALEAEHVKAWYEVRLAKEKAALALDEARVEALLKRETKQVAVQGGLAGSSGSVVIGSAQADEVRLAKEKAALALDEARVDALLKRETKKVAVQAASELDAPKSLSVAEMQAALAPKL